MNEWSRNNGSSVAGVADLSTRTSTRALLTHRARALQEKTRSVDAPEEGSASFQNRTAHPLQHAQGCSVRSVLFVFARSVGARLASVSRETHARHASSWKKIQRSERVGWFPPDLPTESQRVTRGCCQIRPDRPSFSKHEEKCQITPIDRRHPALQSCLRQTLFCLLGVLDINNLDTSRLVCAPSSGHFKNLMQVRKIDGVALAEHGEIMKNKYRWKHGVNATT